MYKNPYEIRLCYLISVSLILYPIKKAVAREPGIGVSVKFSSVIYLTVDNYYLRDFGFISISV